MQQVVRKQAINGASRILNFSSVADATIGDQSRRQHRDTLRGSCPGELQEQVGESGSGGGDQRPVALPFRKCRRAKLPGSARPEVSLMRGLQRSAGKPN